MGPHLRRSRSVLEDEEEADSVVFAHVVERDDVRMAHGGGGACLVPHANDELLAHRRRESEVVAQHLDRDLPSEHGVTREPDAPHAALTEQALDLVAADLLRRRRGSFMGG